MVNASVDAPVVNPTMVVTVPMVDTTMMNPTMVNASVVVAVPMVYPVVNTIVHHPVVDGIVRVLVVVEYVRRVPGLAAQRRAVSVDFVSEVVEETLEDLVVAGRAGVDLRSENHCGNK